MPHPFSHPNSEKKIGLPPVLAVLGGGKGRGITIIRVASKLKEGIDLAFANQTTKGYPFIVEMKFPR